MNSRFRDSVTKVFQTLLDEHRGDHRLALWDLSHRFVIANEGCSWGHLRRMSPATEGKIDDVPDTTLHDDWLRTALGDA